MIKDYTNLNDGVAEIVHNSNICKNCYFIKLKNYSNEKIEMMINREDMERLAKLFNRVIGE